MEISLTVLLKSKLPPRLISHETSLVSIKTFLVSRKTPLISLENH